MPKKLHEIHAAIVRSGGARNPWAAAQAQYQKWKRKQSRKKKRKRK